MNIADFVRLFHLRAPNLMWFLGAGASAAAGIPTAYHLIWRFKQMMYCSEQHVPVQACSDLGDPVLQRRLQQYFDGKGTFPPRGSDEEYASYFEAAIPNEGDRRRFLEGLLLGASLSYGHIALAALMRMGKVRITWTTNFDPLIEDAVNLVYGSTGRLVIATLDAPHLATVAIREERYPIVVKLHGDFRSRRLKNTGQELRGQDSELRKHLVETCSRFGLAVIGYSGRDESVMEAVEEVAGKKGFPFGLFWFHRADSPPGKRLERLVERIRDSGCEAEIIEVETFDELMADLLVLLPDVPDEVQKHLSQKRSIISELPVPGVRGVWPVVRLNALPMLSYPSMCRRVVCEIGGAREVREAVEKAEAKVIATRRQVGVIAFGEDSEIRRAFDGHKITEFDFYAIEPRRLRYESAENGMLREALCKALERERPIKVFRQRENRLMVVDRERETHDLFRSLRKATGGLSGKVPSTDVGWAEALKLRIEYRMDALWLLIEPSIWVDGASETKVLKVSRDFIRRKLASRYNLAWNNIISAWCDVITAFQSECTVRAFGITDGCEASFTISGLSGFSWRERKR